MAVFLLLVYIQKAFYQRPFTIFRQTQVLLNKESTPSMYQGTVAHIMDSSTSLLYYWCPGT